MSTYKQSGMYGNPYMCIDTRLGKNAQTKAADAVIKSSTDIQKVISSTETTNKGDSLTAQSVADKANNEKASSEAIASHAAMNTEIIEEEAAYEAKKKRRKEEEEKEEKEHEARVQANQKKLDKKIAEDTFKIAGKKAEEKVILLQKRTENLVKIFRELYTMHTAYKSQIAGEEHLKKQVIEMWAKMKKEYAELLKDGGTSDVHEDLLQALSLVAYSNAKGDVHERDIQELYWAGLLVDTKKSASEIPVPATEAEKQTIKDDKLNAKPYIRKLEDLKDGATTTKCAFQTSNPYML